MRPKIIDEFTDLPMSRQQKWQLRKSKEGKCIVCGDKAVTGKKVKLCLAHMRARSLASHKNGKCKTWSKNTKYHRILNAIRRHRSVVW